MSGKILAWDPGMTGAVATFYKGELMSVQKMPATRSLIHTLIQTEHSWTPDLEIVIERVPVFIPGKDVMGSQMAVLHGNAGYIEGVAEGITGRPPIFYAPQSWQNDLKKKGLIPKKSRTDEDPNTSAYKTALWEVAKRYYPKAKIYKYACDAILIGHHHIHTRPK